MSVIVLKNDEIKGECKLANFKDGVEVDDFYFEFNSQVSLDSPSASAQRATGRVHVEPFTIKFRYNAAIIPFLRALQNGNSIGDVTISLTKTVDGKVVPFLVYTLHNVMVQTVATLEADQSIPAVASAGYDISQKIVTVRLVSFNTDVNYTSYTDQNSPAGMLKVTGVGAVASS